MITKILAIAAVLLLPSVAAADPTALNPLYHQQRLDAERAQASALQDIAHQQRRANHQQYQPQTMPNIDFSPIGAALRQRNQINADNERNNQWVALERERMYLEYAQREAARWSFIAQSKDGYVFEADRSTLTNNNGLRVILLRYSKGGVAQQFWQATACERNLYSVSYPDGKRTDWIAVKPGSAERVQQWVCSLPVETF